MRSRRARARAAHGNQLARRGTPPPPRRPMRRCGRGERESAARRARVSRTPDAPTPRGLPRFEYREQIGLREHRHAERHRLVVLRARHLACDDEARLLRDASRHLRTHRLQAGAASSRVKPDSVSDPSRRRSGPKASGRPPPPAPSPPPQGRRPPRADALSPRRCRECAGTPTRCGRSSGRCPRRTQALLARLHESVHGAERRRHGLRRGLADVAHAQSEQNPRERTALRPLYGVDELLAFTDPRRMGSPSLFRRPMSSIESSTSSSV